MKVKNFLTSWEQLWRLLLVVLSVVGFFNASPICFADGNSFSLPKEMGTIDKATICRIQIPDGYSFKHGKLFHNYLITQSEQLDSKTASSLYNLFERAFEKSLTTNANNVIAPCLFAPIVGVSFKIKNQTIDMAVSFDCDRILYYNGNVPVEESSLSDIGTPLLVELKRIFPKDEQIQSLK